MRDVELLRCQKRNEGFFACQQKHPLYTPSSNVCRCEINLLKQRGMSNDCTLQRENATALWSELTVTNNWMFTTNQPIIIDIVCDNQLFAQRLEGSGFIHFNTQCLIEHTDMIIQSFKTITTHLNFSFTPAFNLTDVLQTEAGQMQLEALNHDENVELKLLDNQLKELREMPPISSINNHDVHHYVATYVLLFIIIVTVIAYVVTNHRRKFPKLIAPVPMPRREDVQIT